MSQAAMAKANSTRAMALERRKAMSVGGKAALKLAGGNPAPASRASAPSATQPAPAKMSGTGKSAREVSLARRKAMSVSGKVAAGSQDRTRTGSRKYPAKAEAQDAQTAQSAEKGCGCGCGGTRKDTCVNRDSQDRTMSAMPKAPVAVRTPKVASSSAAKTAALARRKALSKFGKAGAGAVAVSEAQAARESNPKLSGRELAKELREQRSKNGNAGQEKSAPCGRQRKTANVEAGPAEDASWKVGASVTVSGQPVTGTMVGRKENMTGDEPSTCRTITGTEYLGADIFNKFCQSGAKATTAKKVEVTTTSRGNLVSGNRINNSTNVTGNEAGACKRVTGNEYTSAENSQDFCGNFSNPTPSIATSMAQTMKGRRVTGANVGRTENVTGNEYGQRQRLTGTQYNRPENIGSAPNKVGVSTTLRGGSVTGSMVGRREQMTGNHFGSCKNVTGDEYAGREQYGKFCKSTPSPTDSKIAVSQTLAGLKVTGDLAQRSKIVTGDEPGTCKATTGTPYAGADQYQAYCDETQAYAAQARMQPSGRRFGQPMTGQQPGIGGKMTGANKGACEPVSGTPYVGSDQAAAACPSVAAERGSPDFPQSANTPWSNFSVSAPIHAAQHDGSFSHVTGSRYESGHITGSFGKAAGKVTGTEEARFDDIQIAQPTMTTFAENVGGRVKSRVTGEGMETGLKITGDDWDRGDQVTGTEGASATQRNMTLRGGPMSAMQQRTDMTRPNNIPEPVSRVTGGSGNTDKGSLITYSGGARG
ncbi:CsoS2 family carboxysome shell protein [Kaarinaea lacus]